MDHRLWLLIAAGGCTPASTLQPADRDTYPVSDVAWREHTPLASIPSGWETRAGGAHVLHARDRLAVYDNDHRVPAWSVTLSATDWGRDGNLTPIGPGVVLTDGATFESRRDGLVEWTEGTPDGVEHGFTLSRRPAGDGPVVVDLAVTADGALDVRGEPTGATFVVDGEPRVGWRNLRAWDSRGRALGASLAIDGPRLRIEVDDRGAAWPVTIDPLITELTGDLVHGEISSGALFSWLGYSISSHGDRLIVGDPTEDLSHTGGVALVVDSTDLNGDWRDAVQLDPTNANGVGASVALEGSTAAIAGDGLVSAFELDTNWTETDAIPVGACGGSCLPTVALTDGQLVVGVPATGEVEVYTHAAASGGDWGLDSVLGPNSGMGASLAADNFRIVAGSPTTGRVYVFDEGVQTALLSDPVLSHAYGAAVSMFADQVAVGAPGANTVYIVDDPAGLATSTPVPAPVFAGDGFGASVALFGSYLAVTDNPTDGTDAQVFTFEQVGDATWALREAFSLGPNPLGLPHPVTLNQSLLAVGHPEDKGYQVFRRRGDILVEGPSLGGDAGSLFGQSLALDADSLLVGGPNANNLTGASGKLFTFERQWSGTTSTTAPLVFAPPVGAQLAKAVDVDGDTFVAGAPGLATDNGMVYVAKRGDVLFSLFLNPASAGLSPTSPARFGDAVAVEGNLLAVGAPETPNGDVLIFTRPDPTGGWSFASRLTGLYPFDKFGKVLALDGGRLVVGTNLGDVVSGANTLTDAGYLRIYDLDDPTSPEFLQEIDGGAASDRFATSLAIDGSLLAVGVRGYNNGAGAVCLYELSWGGTYSLVGSDCTEPGGANDHYGDSVAVVGNKIYVSSETLQIVKMYRRNGDDELGILTEVSGAAAGISFGASLVAHDDVLYVGDPDAAVVHTYKYTGEGDPVARDDFYTYTEDYAFSTEAPGVLANDTDPDGDALSVTDYIGSYATITSNGSVTFTPPQDYNADVVVQYELTAGGVSTYGHVVFRGIPTNDAPVANPDSGYTTSFMTELCVNADNGVLANDTDIDGDALTAIQDVPTLPGLTLSANGSFCYTPGPTVVGLVSFSYHVSDGVTISESTTVQIDVSNDPPEAHVSAIDVPPGREDGPVVLGPPGLVVDEYVTDPEGDPITAEVVAGPAVGGLLFATNGEFIFTGPRDWNGTTSFTVQFVDTLGHVSDAVVVNLTLDPVDDRPVALDDALVTTGEDQMVVIDANVIDNNDYDVDSAALVVALDPTVPPSHGSASINGQGDIEYVPDPDYNGSDTVYYVVDDGNSRSLPAAVPILIRPVNDRPHASPNDLGNFQHEIAGTVLDAGDYDPDGTTFTVELATQPFGGAVTLDPDGTFVYTARPDFTGTDRFFYVLVDPERASSDPAEVKFFVDPSPDTGTTPGTTDTEPPPSTTDCVPVAYYLDADGDGFGSATEVISSCVQPPGYVFDATDCDDQRPDRYPTAVELPGDDIDQDCDGLDNVAEPVGACATAPGAGLGGAPLALLAVAAAALTRRRRRAGLAALGLVAAGPAAYAQNACPDDASDEIEKDITALWQAFTKLDEPGFDRSSKLLTATVSCIDYEVPPAQLARIHHAMALASFVNGQIRACRRSLAAARLADPALTLDESLFPPSHPYRGYFDAATDPGPVDELGKISPKVWRVDGLTRDTAPTERAFLLQVEDDGKIVWTGYMWDWVEIPDYGQSTSRSPIETPQRWVLSGTATGGALAVRQIPSDDSPVWKEESEATFAGGASLVLRATPLTVVGVEVGGSIISPSDPVTGGGGLPAAHAMLLLGGAGWAGRIQPHAAARLGGGVDRVRSWERTPTELDGKRVNLSTLPSAVFGLELGVRTDAQRLMLSTDAYVASFRYPYQVRSTLSGGVLVAGPLAVEGLVESRLSSLQFNDSDGSSAGRRADVDLRVGVGLALWL